MVLYNICTSHYGVDFKKLKAARKNALYTIIMLYLYKEINCKNFLKALTKTFGKDFDHEEFRKGISNNGYLMKHIKPFLYWLVVNKALNKPYLIAKAKSMFKLEPRDSGLHKLVKGKLLTLLRKFNNKGYKALTLKSIDKEMTSLIKDLHVFSSKFAYRKMGFIIRANGIEANDLVYDLLSKGIQSMLFTYPRIETKLHCENIVKLSIHNHGINIIQKYTTKGRNRTLKEKDGTFVNSMMPIPLGNDFDIKQEEGDVNSPFSALVTDISGSSQFGENGFTLNNTAELRISVGKWYDKFQDKRKRFLLLLSGSYDEHFTAYLKDNNVTVKDNDEFFDVTKRIDVYIELCLKYLNVSLEAGLRFLAKLKNSLVDYAPSMA